MTRRLTNATICVQAGRRVGAAGAGGGHQDPAAVPAARERQVPPAATAATRPASPCPPAQAGPQAEVGGAALPLPHSGWGGGSGAGAVFADGGIFIVVRTVATCQWRIISSSGPSGPVHMSSSHCCCCCCWFVCAVEVVVSTTPWTNERVLWWSRGTYVWSRKINGVELAVRNTYGIYTSKSTRVELCYGWAVCVCWQCSYLPTAYSTGHTKLQSRKRMYRYVHSGDNAGTVTMFRTRNSHILPKSQHCHSTSYLSLSHTIYTQNTAIILFLSLFRPFR